MAGKFVARFVVAVERGDEPELLQAELFGQGAEGTWEHEVDPSPASTSTGADANGSVRVDAYFADEQWCPALAKSLVGLSEKHASDFPGLELVVDQDWMASHREIAQPVKVGRFVLDPREPDDAGASLSTEAEEWACDADLWVIRVPLRRAFGSGSHATTRLVLQQLQESRVDGGCVLDVGCGSGVLSFAAHLLGAALVVGYDSDPVAAVLAVENRSLNRLASSDAHFFAGTEDALRGSSRYDLVMVNVLPERIHGCEVALCGHVARGGEVLLSGLLAADTKGVAEALARWHAGGFVEVSRRAEGEWLAVRLRSTPTLGCEGED